MTLPGEVAPAEAGPVLLALARQAIAEALGDAEGDAEVGIEIGADPGPTDATADWLSQPGASFVTLTQDGALRGCIGSVEACRPLLDDVRRNAVAAAFHDRRFAPLRLDELPSTHLEVSVLSTPQPVQCPDEAAALAALRPGVDGVVLAYGDRRATFLPQVWDRLSEPGVFLAALRRKAGLPQDFWADDVRLSRYTVTAWKEQRP